MRVPPVTQLALCFGLAIALGTYFPIHNLPTPFWLIGLLVLAGLIFLIPAVVSFVQAQTTVNPQTPSEATTLVTTGVFSVSRNPMYVGMLFLLLAFVLWLGALSSFLAVVIFYVSIDRFQIKSEEQSLRENFGHAFQEYATRVPRWLFVKNGALK